MTSWLHKMSICVMIFGIDIELEAISHVRMCAPPRSAHDPKFTAYIRLRKWPHNFCYGLHDWIVSRNSWADHESSRPWTAMSTIVSSFPITISQISLVIVAKIGDSYQLAPLNTCYFCYLSNWNSVRLLSHCS